MGGSIESNPHPTEESRRKFIRQAGLTAAGVLSASAAPAQPPASPVQSSVATNPAARFRALLQGPDLVMVPVIWDVMSARLSELEGFHAVMTGGSAITGATYGMGDYGTITITELHECAARVAGSVNVPVVADGDDGGGSPLSVYRAIQAFERAGVASLMIEDLTGAKHVPTGRETGLISKQAMVDKIHAAVDARRDSNFVVLARCDALSAGESADQALERGAAYAQAGADMLFFAGLALKDCPRAAAACDRPLMGSGNTSNNIPFNDLKANKIKMPVYAGQALSVAMGALQQGLKELRAGGTIQNYSQRALPSEIHARLIKSQDSVAQARKYGIIR